MIKIVDIDRLSRKDFRRLNAMTLGSRGLMQYYLESAYEKDKHRLRYRRRERAHILYDINNKLIGWRLSMQYRNCSVCRWKTVIHVFVREKFRNGGYGRILVTNVIDTYPAEKIYCHGNNNFFKHFKVKNVN